MQTKCRVAGFVCLMFAVLVLCPRADAQTNTFSLQPDPASIEVAPGHSGFVTISTAIVSGDAETIGFHADGAPSHVTLSFAPTSVNTGSSTTLTIAADGNATLGATATITVYGTAPSDSETTTVALRVASYLSMDEWTALSSLYDATGGSAWTTHTGWDFSGGAPNGTECAWYGIECDTAPHVTGITLESNHLIGALPDLHDLQALAQIDVSGNQLSGNLDGLDGLSNLQQFQGDNNAFTGTLPQLSTYPNLLGFSAENNQFTGSMPSLTQSSRLVYLDVSSNYLTGIVPSLSGATSLRYLYISGNRFTGVLPPPPSPVELNVASLCPNFFAPIDNVQWDAITHVRPWYSACDTDTIFATGFGAPPSMQ